MKLLHLFLYVCVVQGHTSRDFCRICTCGDSRENGYVICDKFLPSVNTILSAVKEGNRTLIVRADYPIYMYYKREIDSLFYTTIVQTPEGLEFEQSEWPFLQTGSTENTPFSTPESAGAIVSSEAPSSPTQNEATNLLIATSTPHPSTHYQETSPAKDDGVKKNTSPTQKLEMTTQAPNITQDMKTSLSPTEIDMKTSPSPTGIETSEPLQVARAQSTINILTGAVTILALIVVAIFICCCHKVISAFCRVRRRRMMRGFRGRIYRDPNDGEMEMEAVQVRNLHGTQHV